MNILAAINAWTVILIIVLVIAVIIFFKTVLDGPGKHVLHQWVCSLQDVSETLVTSCVMFLSLAATLRQPYDNLTPLRWQKLFLRSAQSYLTATLRQSYAPAAGAAFCEQQEFT